MFNLLPPAEKEIISQDYHSRLTIVGLGFLFSAIILGTLFLLPSYFSSIEKEKSVLLSQTFLKKQLADRSKDNFSAIVGKTKEEIKVLAPNDRTLPYSKLFQIILGVRGGAVTVDSLITKINAEGQSEIMVGGEAGSRQALRAFAKNLELQKSFKRVEVPVSNFAKDKALNFSINMVVTQ